MRRTVLLNGDFADAVGQDAEVEDLIRNSVAWAGATHHGYVGEFNGAFAGLTSQRQRPDARSNLIAGAAGPFTASTHRLRQHRRDHLRRRPPRPRTASRCPAIPPASRSAPPITGVDTHRVIARYTATNNPAIIVRDLDATQVAEFGDNQIDDLLAGNGMDVTIVTDAQLATPGFLDAFDVFVYTRNGSSTGLPSERGRSRQRAYLRAAHGACSTVTSRTRSARTLRSNS